MDREGARNKNMSKRVKKVHSYKRNDHLPVFTQKRKYFQAHDPKRKELGLEYFLFVLSHLTVFNFLAPVFDRAFFSYSYEYRARSGGGYCIVHIWVGTAAVSTRSFSGPCIFFRHCIFSEYLYKCIFFRYSYLSSGGQYFYILLNTGNWSFFPVKKGTSYFFFFVSFTVHCIR